MDIEPFRRGDLVWVMDPDRNLGRHRLAIILGPEPESVSTARCLRVFQGDGLLLSVAANRCVRVPLTDPGGAIHNFAEIIRPNAGYWLEGQPS